MWCVKGNVYAPHSDYSLHRLAMGAIFTRHRSNGSVSMWMCGYVREIWIEDEIKAIFNQSNIIVCMSTKRTHYNPISNHLAFCIWHVTFIYCISRFFGVCLCSAVQLHTLNCALFTLLHTIAIVYVYEIYIIYVYIYTSFQMQMTRLKGFFCWKLSLYDGAIAWAYAVHSLVRHHQRINDIAVSIWHIRAAWSLNEQTTSISNAFRCNHAK